MGQRVVVAVSALLILCGSVYLALVGTNRRSAPASSESHPTLAEEEGPVLEGGRSVAERALPPPVKRTVPASSRTVAGRIVDDQGIPVEGAELTLTGTLGEQRELSSGVTDELGRFQFARVDAGTHTLRLSGRGRETLEREVRVLDADITDLEVVVTSGRSVEVLVEAPDLPTSGILVHVRGSDRTDRYGAADASGRVVFVVPEGPAFAGIVRSPQGWLRGPGPRVSRIAAEQTVLRLPLVRADVITGLVRRRDGQPLPGAVVWFRPGNEAGSGSAVSGSDTTGAVHLAVPMGAVGDLVCQGAVLPDGSPSRVAFYGITRGVRAGASGVVLQVDEVARDRKLDVLVRDPEGGPAGGVRVQAWISGAEPPAIADTDAEGRGTLTKLPARPVHLSVMIMGSGESLWLEPPATEVVPEGQEVVFALRRGARLTGRIAGPAGAIPRTLLEAQHGDDVVVTALSDAEGRFGCTIDPSKHFPLTLYASHLGPRYREFKLEVERLPVAPLELLVSER